jgi:DNA-binding GntR family transcriptional regulator
VDSPPIGWTDTYIDASYSDLRQAIRASPDVLISSLIEREYGRRIAEIHQEVEAAALPQALAGKLQADPASPALKIRRRYLDTEREVFEVSITIHPMDRFIFSMRLTRDGG